MDGINLVGDIHGDYDSLMELVKIMPDCPFLSVGDMIDRGPKSLDVIRFFMKEPNRSVLGNHEHLMLDVYFGRKIYGAGLWLDFRNGGFQTLKSFNPDLMTAWQFDMETKRNELTIEALLKFVRRQKKEAFPEDVMAWVDSLSIYYESDGLFVSHAPRNPDCPWEMLLESKEDPLMRRKMSSPEYISLLWNCGMPGYIPGVTQVHGHVITSDVAYYKDDEKGIFGIGIDTMRGYGTKLTGLHWPSRKIYQVTTGCTATTQNIVEEASAFTEEF